MSDADVAAVYSDALKEWSRLDTRRTEFAVTCLALHDHLPSPPGRILDLGAGPGRYAIHLAERGYDVTVLDLSQQSLDLAVANASLHGVRFDDVICGTATDLSQFPDAAFDAVLCLGPLYHLRTRRQRQLAVSEATRVLRPGGVLFSAHLTRYSFVRYVAKTRPMELVNSPQFLESVLETGVGPAEDGFLAHCYAADLREIAPMLEAAGLDTVGMVGCEGAVAEVEERLLRLQPHDFQKWADLNYRLGQRPELLAASSHVLHIGTRVRQRTS